MNPRRAPKEMLSYPDRNQFGCVLLSWSSHWHGAKALGQTRCTTCECRCPAVCLHCCICRGQGRNIGNGERAVMTRLIDVLVQKAGVAAIRICMAALSFTFVPWKYFRSFREQRSSSTLYNARRLAWLTAKSIVLFCAMKLSLQVSYRRSRGRQGN